MTTEVSNDNESMVISGMKVIPEIPVSSPPASTFNQEDHPHLKDLKITPNIDGKGVDILIGQDFADVLIPLDVCKGSAGQPFAIHYQFG